MTRQDRRLELIRLCHDLRKGANETMDIVKMYEAFIDELAEETGAERAAPPAPKAKAKA